MPELPEVETVRRGLEPVMAGRTLLAVEQRRPDLRFPFPEAFASRLTGRRIEALGRRAKYLLADLDDGVVLVMHLGMSGSFRVITPDGEGARGSQGDPVTPDGGASRGDTVAPTVLGGPDGRGARAGSGAARSRGRERAIAQQAFHHPRGKVEAHDHVVFHLDDGASVVYNDPRRFGYMTLAERASLPAHPLFVNLGIEPLGNELSAATLARAFSGRSAPLKAVLLDQRVIAGLGNIYVCEALWRARLSPRRAAGALLRKDGRPGRRAEGLAAAIRTVLRDAIEAGGSSLRDHVRADGSLGRFQHAFAVYDREGAACPRPACHGAIERIIQSGRSTFFCPVCQR